ncbi:MAG: NAD-dependent dehydratase, partial [Ignavibacteriae bacterium]|nr:NAD-dependent dehydratase [Ignavibacteriota bacterium]
NLPHTFSYIKDFAKGLITFADNDILFGEAWHIPSAETISQKEMVELVEIEIGRKIKYRTAGRKMISFLGLFNPMIKEVKEMMYTMEEPYIVDHSKFEKAFGINVTSHKKAIKETINWYLNENK